MDEHESRIRNLSRIEEDSEIRIIRRVDFIERVAKSIWLILVAIIIGTAVAATGWVLLKSEVERNSNAIKTLWQNDYKVPLP